MDRREIILIYQMGKVGSQTVEQTVRALRPDALIFRTHFLSPDQYDRLLPPGAPDITPEFEASVLSQKRDAAAILDALKSRSDSTRVKMITACREPVAQCVAGCFQNLGSVLPGYQRLRPDECVQQIRSLLVSAWSGMLEGKPARTVGERLLYTLLGVTESWFDQELSAVLSIDVLAVPFTPGGGPILFSQRNMDVLLYRLEDGSTAIEEGLSRLFQVGHVKTINQNLSSTKDYHAAYTTFRQAACLPPGFLDERYRSRWARHFYSAREIAAFRTQWSCSGSSEAVLAP